MKFEQLILIGHREQMYYLGDRVPTFYFYVRAVSHAE